MMFLQIGFYANDSPALCYNKEERRTANGYLMQFSGYQRDRCELAAGSVRS